MRQHLPCWQRQASFPPAFVFPSTSGHWQWHLLLGNLLLGRLLLPPCLSCTVAIAPLPVEPQDHGKSTARNISEVGKQIIGHNLYLGLRLG